MSAKNKYIIAGVILVVLIGAAAIKSKMSFKGHEVEFGKIEVGSITELVSANGKVQPEIQVIISPEVSGEILEIPVREGDKVIKGDLLVKINPDILQAAKERMIASLNQAKANLAQAKARESQATAQYINAELVFNRSEKLKKEGAVSEAQFDTDKASFDVALAEKDAAAQNVEAAKFAVKNAEAAVQEADRNLYRTTIYAPRDGTVSSLKVEAGERVVGAMQMTGTEIMRIADLTRMEVVVDVNESDIVRVKIGDTAHVEVDAYLGRKFKGVVYEIANSAKDQNTTGDQVTNFAVKIGILKNSYADLIDTSRAHLSPFRPGMSGTVDIETAQVSQVLKVPVQAIALRSDTSKEGNFELKECVFVEEDGKAIVKFVETGIQDSRMIEVKKGLNEDDKIITGPYDIVSKKLEAGDEVKENEQLDSKKFRKS